MLAWRKYKEEEPVSGWSPRVGSQKIQSEMHNGHLNTHLILQSFPIETVKPSWSKNI